MHGQVGKGLEERHHDVVRQPRQDGLVLDHADARPRRDMRANPVLHDVSAIGGHHDVDG